MLDKYWMGFERYLRSCRDIDYNVPQTIMQGRRQREQKKKCDKVADWLREAKEIEVEALTGVKEIIDTL